MPIHHNCPLLVTLPSDTSERLNFNVSWGHSGAFSKFISHVRGMVRVKHWGKHFGMHRFKASGQNWRYPVTRGWFCLCLLSLWQVRAQSCSFALDFGSCCQLSVTGWLDQVSVMVLFLIAEDPDCPPKPYVLQPMVWQRCSCVSKCAQQILGRKNTQQHIPRNSWADFLHLQQRFFVAQVEMLSKYIAFFWGIFY